jgi:hypothetical protein
MIKVQDPSFKCINLMLGDVLALRHVERKRSVWHYMKILINYSSGLNYKQKSSNKFILKYKQKSTNSTLFNTLIPKIPFLLN